MNAREKQAHANQLLQSQAGDPSQCVCGHDRPRTGWAEAAPSGAKSNLRPPGWPRRSAGARRWKRNLPVKQPCSPANQRSTNAI